MGECCGENRGTPYCPMCGKQLGSSMKLLLIFVATHAKAARKTEAELIAKRENVTDTPERPTRTANLERSIAARGRTARKWSSWEDGLRDLLATVETQK